MNIYSIRDNKAEAFLQPFFSKNHATAIRAVEEAVADPSHQFAKHASDYAVYHLGFFQEDTGQILPEAPKHLVNTIDFKRVASTLEA